MDLHCRLITENDRAQYNAFVAAHPNGHILQAYEWGEVKAYTGWKPHRLFVEDADGKVRGAALILERDLPAIRRRIFYSPRGPVLDFGDEAACATLFDAVRRLARERRAIFWKIDPAIPVEQAAQLSYLVRHGLRRLARGPDFEGIQPRFVFRLPLDKELDEIFARFAPKTRYNIRLAARRGVTIRSDCTRDDVSAFYSLLQETARRDGFAVRDCGYYLVIWEQLVKRGLARLFMAEYEGRPIAGTLAFAFGDKVWYMYGASGNRHRNLMPNYLLQWEMIRWAKQRGASLYDLRGISGDLNPDNPLYGLYRFKKGFGGVVVEFAGEYDYPLNPLLYRLWNWVEPRYRRWTTARTARSK